MARDPARDGNRLAADAEPRATHAAFADQRHRDALRCSGCDGKADALRREDDGRVDPDDVSPRVDQRSAGVSGIEGRIGLQNVVQQAPRPCAHRPAEAADYARCDGVPEAIRTADCNCDLSDAKPARVAEPAPMKIGRGDLQHREIGIRIVTDDLRRGDTPIRQRHLDRFRPARDMAVRDEIAIRSEQEAGTGRARVRGPGGTLRRADARPPARRHQPPPPRRRNTRRGAARRHRGPCHDRTTKNAPRCPRTRHRTRGNRGAWNRYRADAPDFKQSARAVAAQRLPPASRTMLARIS